MDFNKIAFCGQMGAGKDTVASLFMETHILRAFGTPIKDVIRVLRMYPLETAIAYTRGLSDCNIATADISTVLKNTLKIEQTQKDRAAMQYVGTALRKYYDHIWINETFERAYEDKRTCITDVRRRAELDALREHGYLIFFVDAPEEVRFERLRIRDGIDRKQFFEASQHVAESEIEGLKQHCDFVLDNSSNYSDSVPYQLQQIRERMVY